MPAKPNVDRYLYAVMLWVCEYTHPMAKLLDVPCECIYNELKKGDPFEQSIRIANALLSPYEENAAYLEKVKEECLKSKSRPMSLSIKEAVDGIWEEIERRGISGCLQHQPIVWNLLRNGVHPTLIIRYISDLIKQPETELEATGFLYALRPYLADLKDREVIDLMIDNPYCRDALDGKDRNGGKK